MNFPTTIQYGYQKTQIYSITLILNPLKKMGLRLREKISVYLKVTWKAIAANVPDPSGVLCTVQALPLVPI